MKVKLLYSGGSKEASDGTGFDGILNTFQEQLEKQIKVQAMKLTSDRAKQFSKLVSRAWRSENEAVFLAINNIITDNQFGEIDTDDIDDVIGAGDYSALGAGQGIDLSPGSNILSWPEHHPSTAKRKKRDSSFPKTGVRPDSVNKYYVRTGSLRKYFKDNAAKLGNGLGAPIITYRDTSGRFVSTRNPKGTVAHIGISFMGRANRSLLPGYKAGDWATADPNMAFEKSLSMPKDVQQKLKGPEGKNRPLVQPVVNYFLLYRYPRLMYALLRNATRGTSRNVRT